VSEEHRISSQTGSKDQTRNQIQQDCCIERVEDAPGVGSQLVRPGTQTLVIAMLPKLRTIEEVKLEAYLEKDVYV